MSQHCHLFRLARVQVRMLGGHDSLYSPSKPVQSICAIIPAAVVDYLGGLSRPLASETNISGNLSSTQLIVKKINLSILQ
jgi:hypothetical protein